MSYVVVVDASIAIKWVLNEHDSSTATALLNEWGDKGVEVLTSVLLLYEVTNVLYRRARSGKLPFEDVEKGLKEIILEVLELDFQDSALTTRAIELARQFGLPAVYDGHYLALAEKKGCELWTADTGLWNATKGKLAWVRWMSDYSPG